MSGAYPLDRCILDRIFPPEDLAAEHRLSPNTNRPLAAFVIFQNNQAPGESKEPKGVLGVVEG
jgi:hypothetical protein